MIFSFSVPDNEKNKILIDWYQGIDSQERSRKFREIFKSYLKKPEHTMDSYDKDHVSRSIKPLELARIEIVSTNSNEVDLDSRLDLMGVGGDED